MRLGMLESGRRLKGILRVTAKAIATELARMRILMTCSTLTAQTEERPVQIFQFDLGPGASRDLGCDMAVFAFLPQMLAGQGKACLSEVVELPTVQTHERESQPLMFIMTSPAVRFANRALVRARVKPQAGVHPAPDFGMTFQTLQIACAGSEIVTGSALSQTLQLLVSA